MSEQILLMTRPLDAARAFVARLKADAMVDVQVIYAPLVKIVRLSSCPDLTTYAGVIFTSVNGVECAQNGAGLSAFCVGELTAQAARFTGFDVKLVARDADDLINQMSSSQKNAPIMGVLVHLSGQHRRGDIAERLKVFGLKTDVHVLYDQKLCSLNADAIQALSGEVSVILPLFSPRTANAPCCSGSCGPEYSSCCDQRSSGSALGGFAF